MILEIIGKQWDALFSQLQFIAISWVVVMASIGIDLHFGIRKSKELGLFTHSYGLRHSSQKVVQYLSFMAFMLFFDVLNVFWVYVNVQKVPLATLFGAIVLVYTEAKSVREKTSEKFRKALTQHPAEIIAFIKDNRNLINEVIAKNNETDDNPSN